MKRVCKHKTFHETFIHTIANQLDTIMTMPEEEIIKQGEDERESHMYIIIQGDCDISMNVFGQKALGENLIKGEHFGEIRLIYNCPRSATVICKSYNLIGQLDERKYINLINQYPQFDIELRRYIHTYNDPIKNFFFSCLSKIHYFKENPAKNKKSLNADQFHELMFLFKEVTYSKDEIMIKEMQLTDKLFIIASGNIKFMTTIEGVQDFVVMSLGPGSIINPHNVMIDSELFRFTAVASERSVVFEITKD